MNKWAIAICMINMYRESIFPCEMFLCQRFSIQVYEQTRHFDGALQDTRSESGSWNKTDENVGDGAWQSQRLPWNSRQWHEKHAVGETWTLNQVMCYSHSYRTLRNIELKNTQKKYNTKYDSIIRYYIYMNFILASYSNEREHCTWLIEYAKWTFTDDLTDWTFTWLICLWLCVAICIMYDVCICM